MSGETAISWTHRPGTRGRSWNPTSGCQLKSPGCANCYAMRIAGRFSGKGQPFEGLVTIGKDKKARWNGKTRSHVYGDDLGRLLQPMRWRHESTIFTNSMSDLFYEGLKDSTIDRVVAVMMITSLHERIPHHTYMTLTKRADRMQTYFADPKTLGRVADAAASLMEDSDGWHDAIVYNPTGLVDPHLWWGVSAEDQDAADERIPRLMNTPAAVRMVSIEPMIGPVDLRRVRPKPFPIDALTGGWATGSDAHHQEGRIHWVIAGVESGPGARPAQAAWFRALREQCAATGTAFFLKQAKCELEDVPGVLGQMPSGTARFAVAGGKGSKKKGGGIFDLPYLDGRQHKAWPDTNGGIIREVSK